MVCRLGFITLITALASIGLTNCGGRTGGSSVDEEGDGDTDSGLHTDTGMDTGTDGTMDTGSETDSGADVDTGNETTEPVATPIVIVNNSGVTKYFSWGITMPDAFSGSRALNCEYSTSSSPEDWQTCLMDSPYCEPLCHTVEVGDECGVDCEPDAVTKRLLPDETVEIPWNALLFQEDQEHCSWGICYDSVAAPPGLYRLSLEVYEELLHCADACEPDEEGLFWDIMPTGTAETFSVEVELPAITVPIELNIGR